MTMPETADEHEYWGNVYKRRRELGGPWGYAYEVYAPFDDDPIARGWRTTLEQAESAMKQCVEDAQNGKQT